MTDTRVVVFALSPRAARYVVEAVHRDQASGDIEAWQDTLYGAMVRELSDSLGGARKTPEVRDVPVSPDIKQIVEKAAQEAADAAKQATEEKS